MGERLSHRRQNNFERRNASGRERQSLGNAAPESLSCAGARSPSTPALILIHLIKIKQSNRVPLP
jgi:hypothetical protein